MDQSPLIAHINTFDFTVTLYYPNYIEFHLNVTLKSIFDGKEHHSIHYLFLGDSDIEESLIHNGFR